MPDDLETILPELKAGLVDLYGDRLRRVILYGSQVRGDADEDSDIDVMVVLEGPVRPGEEIFRTVDLVSELSLKHTTLLACTFVAESDYHSGSDPLIINVLREGVSV